MDTSIEIEMLNERIDDQNRQIEELKDHLDLARKNSDLRLELLNRWLVIADDLADKLAAYEATDHAGIGEQALANYKAARHA